MADDLESRLADVDIEHLSPRQIRKRSWIANGVAITWGFATSGTFEYLAQGFWHMARMRSGMAFSSIVLKVGRGYDYFREAYMHVRGINKETFFLRRYVEEGFSQTVYWTPVYTMNQVLMQTVNYLTDNNFDVEKITSQYGKVVTTGLAIGYFYGKIRDFTFKVFGEQPKKARTELSPQAAWLSMPAGDALRLAKQVWYDKSTSLVDGVEQYKKSIATPSSS